MLHTSPRACRAMLDTLEAAYARPDAEAEWASTVLEQARPWFDRGVWSVLATFRKDEHGVPQVQTCVQNGAPFDVRAAIQSGTERLDRATLDAVYDGHATLTLSQLWRRLPDLRAVFEQHIPAPARDICQLTARSVDGEGALLSAALREPTRLSKGTRERYTCVAAHITAAHRLRRALGATPSAVKLGDHALREAIVTPDGAVAHAEGVARDAGAREALREAARALDWARTRAGRAAASDAMDAWKALVAGRWTVVESFDSDGRRYLVAMVNPPSLHASLALAADEAAIAELVGLGHSQKYVAYELGISQSDVSRGLKSALARLGLTSRADLATVVRAVRT